MWQTNLVCTSLRVQERTSARLSRVILGESEQSKQGVTIAKFSPWLLCSIKPVFLMAFSGQNFNELTTAFQRTFSLLNKRIFQGSTRLSRLKKLDFFFHCLKGKLGPICKVPSVITLFFWQSSVITVYFAQWLLSILYQNQNPVLRMVQWRLFCVFLNIDRYNSPKKVIWFWNNYQTISRFTT